MRKPIIPINMTEELSEIIGRHCGDGCCTRGKNFTYKISLKEHPSLIKLHKEQMKQMFNLEGKICKVSDISEELVIHSKKLLEFIESLGIPSKNKTHTVREPETIKNSSKNIRRGFLRGLIDTDGYIWYDKSNRTLKLEFHTVNKNLAESVFEILKLHNFKSRFKYCNDGTFSVILAGKKNVFLYIEKISSNNIRIISKVGQGSGKLVSLAEKAMA